MNKICNIIAVFFLLLIAACRPDASLDKFSLSCGSALTIREAEQSVIEVRGGGNYAIETDNRNAACNKNGNIITVDGVKVGQCTLIVTSEGGEVATCVITIEKSAAQKDFLVFSNPRIENWMPEPVYVERTDGLQVTCEKDTDVAGAYAPGTTTYGFYFVETGEFCRLSAPGDFTAKGNIAGGIVAIGGNNKSTQYYLCENVAVLNVLNGKAWIEASMSSRSDIRMVVELY